MGRRTLDVLARAAFDVGGLLVGYVADTFGRDADDEAMGRELAALGDDGARGDYGAFAYLRAVQDRRAHADEAVVPDLAPVHDRVVADDATLADDRGKARVGMQDAPVLDVGTVPDANGLRVAAQHGPVPYARLLTQVYVSNNEGSWRDPGGLGYLRKSVAVREQVAVLVQIQRRTLPLYCRYSSPNLRSR